MKRWCLIVIVFLALASIVSAQTVSTAELKSVLIDSIKDYLSSQTPKLEKAELKDLIVIYLSTKGDTADLSGNGIFSGKKLFDVYNKAKGVAVCTGTCKPNACNTYTNCASLSTGTCTSGYCCSGNCIPANAEILPWDLKNYMVSGSVGQKNTYIVNFKPNTSYAEVYIQASDPTTVVTITIKSIPGYLYRGISEHSSGVRYSSAAQLVFAPSYFSPKTADGFVPHGDFTIEILWVGAGRVLINTVYI